MNLDTAQLYLVAPPRVGTVALADLVPEFAAAGVDLIQLRDKQMDLEALRKEAAAVLDACRDASVPLILNDYPELAGELGADGVHVGQDDTPVPAARRASGGIVGLSTHSRGQIAAADPVGPDYVAVGPVFATPTKPGRPAVGLDLVGFAAAQVRVPWFAIGGIDLGNIAEVTAAGARRVVVVRAITDAPDPIAAAAALKAALQG